VFAPSRLCAFALSLNMRCDTVIIGAGISGLVAAHRLKRFGRRVMVLERSPRPGGVIESIEVDGFLLERGPNSLRGTHDFLELIDELGIREELVTADPRAPAYIFSRGELHAVPMGPLAALSTRLLSPAAKLRLLREPFLPPRQEAGEESIAAFVRRRFGSETLDHLVSPFISGVYAGNVEQLSAQASLLRLVEFEAQAGSITRGAVRAAHARRRDRASIPQRSLRPFRLSSFRGGLKTLPLALARDLGESLYLAAPARRITLRQQSREAADHEISIEIDGSVRTITAPTLIVATEAYAAADLLKETAPALAALIGDIPYNSLVSVPFGYRREQLKRKLDGFGFLATRDSGLRILGSIWNSSLFPARSPAGFVCLTNLIGGATDDKAVTLSDQELARIVHHDLQQVLGITGEPRHLPITRYAKAIPQYVLGHVDRVARIETAASKFDGFWLLGNYMRNVSLGECIRQANATAGEVEGALVREHT